MSKQKITPSQMRALIMPALAFAYLVSLIIIALLQYINQKYGLVAFVAGYVLFVFFIQIKYSGKVKHWFLQGLILFFIGYIVTMIIDHNEYKAAIGLYLLGIVLSGIIDYNVLKEFGEKNKRKRK